MIHFTILFSNDPSGSPFVQSLRKLNIEYKIFSKLLLFRYKNRWMLGLFGWTELVFYSFIMAIKSLVLSKPKPDVVVLEQHLQVLVFVLIRCFTWHKPTIVYRGFIFTQRKSSTLNKLRLLYFRFLFSKIDAVISYSKLELQNMQQVFGACKAAFFYIPYGLHMHGSETVKPMSNEVDNSKPYIFSAGRSSRDYSTLIDAVKCLDYDLHIACDMNHEAFVQKNLRPGIKILDKCYDDEYVEQLRNARCVVIPLNVDNISAGQMVMIQAMAFGRPLIITNTLTIQEYIKDSDQAILVERGNPEAMREAICRVMEDPAVSYRLSLKGLECYANYYSMSAHVNNLLNIVLKFKRT
jgi:glycosyltransferase involved in cell wall biosynthesis